MSVMGAKADIKNNKAAVPLTTQLQTFLLCGPNALYGRRSGRYIYRRLSNFQAELDIDLR